jgi:hypothetical protein
MRSDERNGVSTGGLVRKRSLMMGSVLSLLLTHSSVETAALASSDSPGTNRIHTGNI